MKITGKELRTVFCHRAMRYTQCCDCFLEKYSKDLNINICYIDFVSNFNKFQDKISKEDLNKVEELVIEHRLKNKS